MELNVTLLGTGAGNPSKDRNVGMGININFNGENYLFDPAENSQQLLMKAGISIMKINNIFISHFHADHFLGLPGLIATMNMLERKEPLKIYGPKKIKDYVKKMTELAVMKPNFEIKCIELKKGVAVENESSEISAFPLKHSAVCFGFSFKEKDSKGKFNREKAIKLGIPVGPLFSKLQNGESIKLQGKTIKPEMVLDKKKKKIGRKISFVPDNELKEESYVKEIKDSDLLIHESVFLENQKEEALKKKHSTALKAGKIAEKAKVKMLVLTHFSSRYKTTDELIKEAKKKFKNTIAGNDLMKIEVKRNV